MEDKRTNMQEHKENTLIEHLKEIMRTSRHSNGEYTWHHQRVSVPVTIEELAQAEVQLGFALPSFLRRLYLEVGNGGFGPGYGLYPLNSYDPSINSLVTEYLGMRSMSQKDIDEHWADEEVKPSLWPERALMLCDWGCNMYSCLDCSSPDLPIFRMDSNQNVMVEWAVEASSLEEWLENWLDGKPWTDLNWKKATKVSVSLLWKMSYLEF